jgi:hypothetical protein
MDMKQGLLCGLTGEKADFEDSCPNFELDEKVEKAKANRFSGSSPASMPRVRPNKKRADLAKLFIWLVLFFDFISIISSYLQYNLLVSYESGGDVSFEMLEANDLREQIVAVIYTLVYWGSIFVFLQWFRRAYYNLNVRRPTAFPNSWAIWSWIVPIISLFRPVQIMKEMWDGTSDFIKKYQSDYKQEKTMLLGLWWTLWLVANIIANIVMRVAIKVETIDDLINSSVVDIVFSIISIPLAVVTVRLIQAYSEKEEKLLQLENENKLRFQQASEPIPIPNVSE